MNYYINHGGVVISGEAEPRDIAALARELGQGSQGAQVLELPVGNQQPLPEPQAPPMPRPPTPNAPEPQPLPLGNGHQPTLSYSVPESCYRQLKGYQSVQQLGGEMRTRGPGRAFFFDLTPEGAVVLYEAIQQAVRDGAAHSYPGIYHQRIRLEKILDEHFGINAEELVHG